LIQIPALGVGISMFSVPMATSDIANRFLQHGLQLSQSIATYIIFSGMSVFGACVQITHLDIISLLTSNTPSRITPYIECSAIPPPLEVNAELSSRYTH
jgi:hypothetical protein